MRRRLETPLLLPHPSRTFRLLCMCVELAKRQPYLFQMQGSREGPVRVSVMWSDARARAAEGVACIIGPKPNGDQRPIRIVLHSGQARWPSISLDILVLKTTFALPPPFNRRCQKLVRSATHRRTLLVSTALRRPTLQHIAPSCATLLLSRSHTECSTTRAHTAHRRRAIVAFVQGLPPAPPRQGSWLACMDV